MNAHERLARAKKASKLVAALNLLDDVPSADQVADFGPRTWEILAQIAGVRPPSAETVKAVVALLREREDLDELISGPPSSGMRRSA